MADRGEITRLLEAHRQGRPGAFDRLVSVVYDDLKAMARRELARGRPEGLRTTILVHEAYARLASDPRLDLEDRRHFFGAAARAMRQVVVDMARRWKAAKRGGGRAPMPLDETRLPVEDQAETVLAIDAALHRLGEIDPRLVRVVEHRFFGGFTVEETADALEISTRTVERDWTKARGWLRRELSEV